MAAEMEFNIQRALTDMETRLSAEIVRVGEQARLAAVAAQSAAQTALLANATMNGRVTNLEEKAGWVKAGIGTTLVGMAAFIWHIVSGGHP